jgi:hypothetical protein
MLKSFFKYLNYKCSVLKCLNVFGFFLQVAKYLQQHGQIQYAREMYKKMGDVKSVVTLYVEAQVTTSIIFC